MSEPRYESSCVERFLRYVRIDTQSDESSESYPSTAKQLDLLRLLVDELRELGLDDATMDEHGYVFATIPATTSKTGVPTIGFIAHVDTSPDMSGKDVQPIVHRSYDGGDIRLPKGPDVVIPANENRFLAEQVGHDIITASGDTLLGADNKAGVAEIVGAAEYLTKHPEIPHGPIRVGFTPDEEIGQGTKYFDVERFGAFCAYTMDGSALGELQTETFSADSMHVTFHGHNTHPGFAKDKMINAIKIAADFIGRLPRDTCSPETTEAMEGFVHPHQVDAGNEKTTVKLLVRDFNTSGLEDKERMLERLAHETVADWPGARVELEVIESYRNMREVLDRHPEIVANAAEAIGRAGVEVRAEPIRGGTDGSRLSFMGLPTPNIFAGEHNFHSRYEWVSTRDMHKAVEVIVELAKIWEEKAPG
jgi:tripeptide aminopeptidase